MIQPLLQIVEDAYKKSQSDVPQFAIGDTVTVHVRIVEGEKERVQPYTGVVIARRGRGMTENFTVRRIVNNEGVERIFPVHSPKIAKVEVVRSGHVRRAKLYYLRDRVGKSRRLRDRKTNKAPAGTTTEATAGSGQA
ncbi:MAG: 50S ribosomal protein L19 [Phycisphaerae bacterium]